jgi:hypothetical protein
MKDTSLTKTEIKTFSVIITGCLAIDYYIDQNIQDKTLTVGSNTDFTVPTTWKRKTANTYSQCATSVLSFTVTPSLGESFMSIVSDKF